MSGVFFCNIPCDLRGHSICLTLPQWILYLTIHPAGVFLSYFAAEPISILFFGNTLSVTLSLFVLLIYVVELVYRVILRFAEWKETDPASQEKPEQSLD